MLNVRPYCQQDKAAVYEVCRRTCDDGADGTEIFPENPDLIGDKLIGSFLQGNHEYCFVVEDSEGVCGYVLASLDAREHHNKMDSEYTPSMCVKYPKPEATEGLSPSEEMICGFYGQKSVLPDSLYSAYPSILRMDMLPNRVPAVDADASRRALACAVAALKVNGSHGIFAEVHVGDVSTAEAYAKLGFFRLMQQTVGEAEEATFLARVI